MPIRYKFTFRTDNFVPGAVVKYIPDKISVYAETKGEAFNKAKIILHNPEIALLEPIMMKLADPNAFEDDLRDVQITLESVEAVE
jgi:hypothetical protein